MTIIKYIYQIGQFVEGIFLILRKDSHKFFEKILLLAKKLFKIFKKFVLDLMIISLSL